MECVPRAWEEALSHSEASAALANLAADNNDHQLAIEAEGGIAPLVELARSGTAGAKHWAAGALNNLAHNADIRVAIAAEGGIAVLVELTRRGTADAKEDAADT